MVGSAALAGARRTAYVAWLPVNFSPGWMDVGFVREPLEIGGVSPGHVGKWDATNGSWKRRSQALTKGSRFGIIEGCRGNVIASKIRAV